MIDFANWFASRGRFGVLLMPLYYLTSRAFQRLNFKLTHYPETLRIRDRKAHIFERRRTDKHFSRQIHQSIMRSRFRCGGR
jgi:hypothetical protein